MLRFPWLYQGSLRNKTMSKGLENVQWKILEMIASDPHGAWNLPEICAFVYNTSAANVEKRQRVAVLRAIKTMTLPGSWKLGRSGDGENQIGLYDPCDTQNVALDHFGLPYESLPDATRHQIDTWVSKANFLHIATPLELVDAEIAENRSLLSLGHSGIGVSIESRLHLLEQKRLKLLALASPHAVGREVFKHRRRRAKRAPIPSTPEIPQKEKIDLADTVDQMTHCPQPK